MSINEPYQRFKMSDMSFIYKYDFHHSALVLFYSNETFMIRTF